MAGSLIKIQEVEISSAVASVTLGGSEWDSSYDVYMIQLSNVEIDSASKYLVMRVTENGTPNTSAYYDASYKNIKSSGLTNSSYSNLTYFYTINNVMGNTANQTFNGVKYIFNANNSNQYTFFTNEVSAYSNPSTLWGNTGSELYQSKSQIDGVQFFLWDTGNIDNGIISIYGLRN